MSPIYTRPIREQFEHDRVIRELQARYKRKFDVAINPGAEQNQSVMVGDLAVFPDLVLLSGERGRRIEGTVEVETVESVHLLEARAEWGVFSRLKVPFYLYVPPQTFDTARRICDEQQFDVAEIWTYHTGLDQQVRFTQVYKSPARRARVSIPAPKPEPKKPAPAAPAAAPAPAGEAAESVPLRPAGSRVAAAASAPVRSSKVVMAARKGAGRPAASRTKAASGRQPARSRSARPSSATGRTKPAKKKRATGARGAAKGRRR